jgi:hypothetical protein
VLSILEKDLDKIDLPNVEQQTQVTEKPHENLRGADYFAQLEQ